MKFIKMKLSLPFLLLLLIITTSSFAQQLGIKAGLNFTNVSNEKDIDLSSSNGFHAGLAIEVPTLPLISIGTGLFYTRRGYKSNEVGKDGNVSIDYLDIPVDLMIKIKVADLIGAYISAGPYFSYGISSKVFDANGILQNGFDNDDIDLNRIDSGVNIGLGVDFTNIRLSAAYGASFTDNGSEPNIELKNRVLKISVGYFFN
jgi:hypothetical protein